MYGKKTRFYANTHVPLLFNEIVLFPSLRMSKENISILIELGLNPLLLSDPQTERQVPLLKTYFILKYTKSINFLIKKETLQLPNFKCTSKCILSKRPLLNINKCLLKIDVET